MFAMDFKMAKQAFFTSPAVTGAVDRATRKVLSKFGAFVRRGAKSSIRRRKRVSDPGKPPSSHTGLLKRFIFFGYDRADRTVVIGPVALRSKPEAPELLEYGGQVQRRVGRRRPKLKTMRYRPRPFMQPAFETEKPKLPAMWKDSVA